MWRVFKLQTLVWSHMYDDTVHCIDGNAGTLALPHARSLKIEPEIVFGLKRFCSAGRLFRNHRNRCTTHDSQQKMQRAHVFADSCIWYDAVAGYSQLIAENPNDGELYQARAEIYGNLPQTKSLAAADMTKAKGAK
jgi:hypothetical protein